MKKHTVIILFLMLLVIPLVLLVSLASNPKTSDGIGYIGEEVFYTIKMTDEERESYFTVENKAGSVAVSYYGKTGITAIPWYHVKGGGYIAWIGHTVRYVPENFSNASKAFATLTSDSSAMSINEAKAYVPQLTK